MKFKPTELKAKIDEVLANHTDQATVSAILSEIVEHNTEMYADYEKATKTAEDLTTANEKLRSTNMDLFLKIGDVKQPESKKDPVDNTPKYEDLFDENGELK